MAKQGLQEPGVTQEAVGRGSVIATVQTAERPPKQSLLPPKQGTRRLRYGTPFIWGVRTKPYFWHHKLSSCLPGPGPGQRREARKKNQTPLLLAVACLSCHPQVFGLLLSALLCLHEAFFLVAGGLDLRVGGVVGVVAELHDWPVVRSPLRGHRGKVSEYISSLDPVSEGCCMTLSLTRVLEEQDLSVEGQLVGGPPSPPDSPQ